MSRSETNTAGWSARVPEPDPNGSPRSLPLRSLSASLAGEWTQPPPESVTAVRIDSRNCQSGDLFVALPGSNTHGHEFVEDAVSRGAAAALVEDPQPGDVPQLVVPHAETALQELARRARRRPPRAVAIGITGSCGKTTVKEMIARVLGRQYQIGKTRGNRNNQLGLPLTLLNQGRGQVLVAELGINRVGEMEQLAKWLQPDCAVVTHIGPAHLEGLDTTEQLAEEKAQLVRALPGDGAVFLPDDLDHAGCFRRGAATPVTVGPSPQAAVPTSWESAGDGTELHTPRGAIPLRFQGDGLARDAALAAAVGEAFEVPFDQVKAALGSFEPLGGRGRTLSVRGTTLIDGSYNANPDSVRSALSRLRRLPAPRLAVLGEMKELGTTAERWHERVGEWAGALEDTDLVFVGEHRAAFRRGVQRAGADVRAAAGTLEGLPSLDPGSYRSVLVKGSHALRLDRLIDRWTDGV